jgi:hypothetical protein
MARHTDPTPEQQAAWTSWLAARPPGIRAVASRFDPWTLYRLRDSGHRVTFLGCDDGDPPTVRVGVSAKWNLVGFERQVYGVRPEELVECDLPAPDEPVGDGGVTLEDMALPEPLRKVAIQEKADAFWRRKGETQ